MTRDVRLLEDIVHACEAIGHFIGDSDEAEFDANDMLLSAVLYKFVVIGEASRRMSLDLKSAYPAVPWAQAISLRNFIAHGYDVVRSAVIWRTAKNDLPRYAASMRIVLQHLGDQTP